MLSKSFVVLLLVAMVSSRSLTRRQEEQSQAQNSSKSQDQEQKTVGRVPLVLPYYSFDDPNDPNLSQDFTGGLDKSLQSVQRVAAVAAAAAQRGVTSAQLAAQHAVDVAQQAAVGGLQSAEAGATALGELAKETVATIASFAALFTNLLAGLGEVGGARLGR